MTYDWLIIIHWLALISWFAGLFYLPRLFVYHTRMIGKEDAALFSLMESRLYTIIMRPAMLAVIISGLSLIHLNGWEWFKMMRWLHIKLLAVILLIAYHHWLGSQIKRFKAESGIYSETFYRIINEIPTVLCITIICCVKLRYWF